MNTLSPAYINSSLQEAHQLLTSFLGDPKNIDQINQGIKLFVECFAQGGKVMTCGNGGSYCDSMHFTEELTGRYRKDRRPLGAICLGDQGHMTCVANDFGYDHVFSRLVDGLGKSEDVLMVISTSGNSKNCILAVEEAKKKKMKVVGLLGKDGGQLKNMVDVPIIVPHKITDRIQEIHIKIIHIFIEGIERHIFPENYR